MDLKQDSNKPLLPPQAVLDFSGQSENDSHAINTMTVIPSHIKKADEDDDENGNMIIGCCLLAIVCAVVPSYLC